MRKASVVLGLALVAFIGSVASAAIPTRPTMSTAGSVTLIYDPADGNLTMDTGGTKVSTLEIKSAAGYFTGTKPSQLAGLFDVYNKNKMFQLQPAGLDTTNYGPALAKGLDLQALAADLEVGGSILPKGAIPGVALYAAVPEPASFALFLGAGLLGLAGLRKRS